MGISDAKDLKEMTARWTRTEEERLDLIGRVELLEQCHVADCPMCTNGHCRDPLGDECPPMGQRKGRMPPPEQLPAEYLAQCALVGLRLARELHVDDHDRGYVVTEDE